MSRIVLLAAVALLGAGSSALWAATYKAVQEVGDLTKNDAVTIAGSAVSISESFGPADPHCRLTLVQIEFS